MKGCGSLRGEVKVLDFEEIGLDKRDNVPGLKRNHHPQLGPQSIN